MKKSWDRAAMRFASVRYVDRQGMLDAIYENGDHFLVAVELILPAVRHAVHAPSDAGSKDPSSISPLEWGKLRISETGGKRVAHGVRHGQPE